MRENATLKELMEAYEACEKTAKTLRQNGKNWLLERESGELLAEHVTKDEKNGNLIIRVYKDGFVYFEERKHFTVFSLEDVKGAEIVYEAVAPELTVKVSRSIAQEDYLQMCWYVALYLISMDRMASNGEKKQGKHMDCHITDEMQNLYWMGRTVDFLEKERREELERRVLGIIKPRNWQIFRILFYDQMTQQELANCLHKTQQAVSKIYRDTLNKLAAHAAEFEDFHEDYYDQSSECRKRFYRGSYNLDSDRDKDEEN